MGIFSLLFYSMGIFFLLAFVIAIIARLKNGKGPSPKPAAIISLGLLVIQWILFLIGFYAWMPSNLADILFTVIWIIVLLAAAVSTIIEFRNNRIFALFLGLITFYSSLFVVLAHLIGSM